MEVTVIFNVQKEECGFSAKAVDYPIFTQGDSLDDLLVNIRESLACHFNNPVQFTIRPGS